MPEVDIHPWEFYISELEKDFGTTELRRNAALILAGPDPEARVPNVTDMTLSRLFILSHWGEDRDGFRQVAVDTYNLKNRLSGNKGEPAIVIDEEAYKQLTTRGEEPDLDDIEITSGLIALNELHYGFSGNTTYRGLSRKGVAPPLLSFIMRLPMSDVLTTTIADMIDVRPNSEPDETVEDVEISYGVVPLRDDTEVYQAEKFIERKVVLMGRQACQPVVSAAARYTELTQALPVSLTS